MSAITNLAYQAINTEQSSGCDCSDARTVIPLVVISHQKHHHQQHHHHTTSHQHQNSRRRCWPTAAACEHATNQQAYGCRRQNGAKLLNNYSYRKQQNITHNRINYINSQLHSVNSYSKQHVSSECSLSVTSVLSAFIVWSISFKGTWCKRSSELPKWTKVIGMMFALLLCSGSVEARPNNSVTSPTTMATVETVPAAAALTRAVQPPQVESSVSS